GRIESMNEKKKLLLIINPKAGRSSYKIGFADVMLTLSQGGYDTTVRFTEGRGDATRFAAEHAKEFDTIACIGGDGTLSEVVAGLMQVDNPPPLGYIPLGSTNDVANTLSLPHSAVEAAERIVSVTSRRFP
ncbi:MAG: acylglycerol kinase family protein, partial [Clostridia bacterium]|nr:acylglycerol kinase family protein [Clostridia bacterium]